MAKKKISACNESKSKQKKKKTRLNQKAIQQDFLNAKLEEIFIENKIYQTLEISNCQSEADVLQAITLGLQPFTQDFPRPITQADLRRLANTKMIRISTYGISQARHELKSLESSQPYRTSYQTDYKLPPENVVIEKMPFCCAVCHCSPDKRAEAMDVGAVAGCIFPDIDYLGHRICCHDAFDADDEWKSPYMSILEEAYFEYSRYSENSKKGRNSGRQKYNRVQKSIIRKANRKDKKLLNAIRIDVSINLGKGSNISEKSFHRLQKRRGENLPHAVVLNCFGGVGAGVVSLKRLGISVSQIIHVERDKVATHVYRCNHDPDYSSILPRDDIRHVYVENIEDITQNIDAFLCKYGAIDIVLGGTACFADAPSKDGMKVEEDHYVLLFRQLIESIQSRQKNHPVFFLAEILAGTDPSNQSFFGLELDHVQLDSRCVSPFAKLHTFLTNIPIKLDDYDLDGVVKRLGPASCLEEGFKTPAMILNPINPVVTKVSCAAELSARHIHVFREVDNSGQWFEIRRLKICELENLMGYKKGYSEVPVRELFQELNGNALFLQRRDDADKEPQLPWREKLPTKYHHFAGNYHHLPGSDPYRFELASRSEPPEKNACESWDFVKIKMAPPTPVDQEPYFCTDSAYAAHLINHVSLYFWVWAPHITSHPKPLAVHQTSSIPVLDLLLTRLKEVYASQQYPGFNYKFAWHDDLDALRNAVDDQSSEDENIGKSDVCPDELKSEADYPNRAVENDEEINNVSDVPVSRPDDQESKNENNEKPKNLPGAVVKIEC